MYTVTVTEETMKMIAFVPLIEWRIVGTHVQKKYALKPTPSNVQQTVARVALGLAQGELEDSKSRYVEKNLLMQVIIYHIQEQQH